MARCDEGYLCEVCGEPVEEITDSDLYLRYVIGQISIDELTNSPERHICCNPVQAQFIVDESFEAVAIDGAFDKRQLDPDQSKSQQELITRGWRRLQQVAKLGISIADYPLDKLRAQ